MEQTTVSLQRLISWVSRLASIKLSGENWLDANLIDEFRQSTSLLSIGKHTRGEGGVSSSLGRSGWIEWRTISRCKFQPSIGSTLTCSTTIDLLGRSNSTTVTHKTIESMAQWPAIYKLICNCPTQFQSIRWVFIVRQSNHVQKRWTFLRDTDWKIIALILEFFK